MRQVWLSLRTKFEYFLAFLGVLALIALSELVREQPLGVASPLDALRLAAFAGAFHTAHSPKILDGVRGTRLDNVTLDSLKLPKLVDSNNPVALARRARCAAALSFADQARARNSWVRGFRPAFPGCLGCTGRW